MKARPIEIRSAIVSESPKVVWAKSAELSIYWRRSPPKAGGSDVNVVAMMENERERDRGKSIFEHEQRRRAAGGVWTSRNYTTKTVIAVAPSSRPSPLTRRVLAPSPDSRATHTPCSILPLFPRDAEIYYIRNTPLANLRCALFVSNIQSRKLGSWTKAGF